MNSSISFLSFSQKNSSGFEDLSENLYRMCVGYPIRLGHANLGFYEDMRVINKAINATIENYMFYAIGYIGPNNDMPRNGLGKCCKP